jgi:hypothetical protein
MLISTSPSAFHRYYHCLISSIRSMDIQVEAGSRTSPLPSDVEASNKAELPDRRRSQSAEQGKAMTNQRQKRPHTKSRWGCYNCRARRVKVRLNRRFQERRSLTSAVSRNQAGMRKLHVPRHGMCLSIQSPRMGWCREATGVATRCIGSIVTEWQASITFTRTRCHSV